MPAPPVDEEITRPSLAISSGAYRANEDIIIYTAGQDMCDTPRGAVLQSWILPEPVEGDKQLAFRPTVSRYWWLLDRETERLRNELLDGMDLIFSDTEANISLRMLQHRWSPKYRVCPNCSAKRIQGFLDDATWIKDLPDDWNDEGAKPINSLTWLLLEKTLRSVAVSYNELKTGKDFPEPAIAPVPDGRIDLYWESLKGLVIATMPLEEQETVYVYCRNTELGTVRLEIPQNVSDMSVFAQCIAKTVT